MPEESFLVKNTDSRLIQAYNTIDAGAIDILSLDIFDTLLWRKIPSPEDLFLILGKSLKEEGWLIPAVSSESFAQLRISAEQSARLEKEYALKTTEVTLPEIYWQLQSLFIQLSTDQMLAKDSKGIYDSDVSTVVEKEVALEQELIQFDQNIFNLILYARQKNIRIVLVSDTYFEESHILQLLESACLLPNPPILPYIHRLFLSCECGCDKKDGLFLQVIKDLNVNPRKILHIGDNYKRDVLPAAELGIKTLYYQKYEAAFEEILEREWTQDSFKRERFLDRKEGDFGITSLRTKIAHYVDLLHLKREDQFFWKYGATILGPVLLGFVHWIYSQCSAMKESQVFCLMREGKLYAELIERFAPCFPEHKLEAKHLWVSRLFITHASIGYAHQSELMKTMNAFLEQFTIENFCSYLGLNIDNMPKWSRYRHVMLEDPALRKKFILDLIRNPSLRHQIIQTASAKRERFLKYFSGLTHLSSPAQMTLVDVGWNGSAQGAMQQILHLTGSPLKLHGLYLGTTETTNTDLLRGIIREGYLFRGGHPPCNNAHKKGCYVLEQTATAETGVGSLQDIDEDGNIITSPLLIPPKQKKQAELVQKGIFALFDLAASYLKSGAMVLNSNSEALQNQLRGVFLRSMINTTQKEALKFGPWFHEHGPASNLIQVIGKNAYYENFIKDMLPVAAFNESGLNWPAAYAAKNSKYLTLISQAMWLKTLPPKCFLSEDNFSYKIFLDTGKNFPKKAHQNLNMRSNPNRNFYSLAKLFSSKKSIQRLQLMLSFPSALVRIKSLRIITYDRNMPDPQQFTFFESEKSGMAQLECISGRQIDFNTFHCQEDLKLIHTFEQSGIYQIKVKLCCEMFKLELKTTDSRKTNIIGP